MTSRTRECMIDAPGARIYCKTIGSGPPLLLLHGGPGLSEYLDTLVAELDGLVTTARYQQRGLAPSVVSGDISIEGHVADAVAVMDALGWDRPLVIGHSWGGHFALHLAVARPARIGGLVIIDALGAVGDYRALAAFVAAHRDAGVTLPAIRPIGFPDAPHYLATLEAGATC